MSSFEGIEHIRCSNILGVYIQPRNALLRDIFFRRIGHSIRNNEPKFEERDRGHHLKFREGKWRLTMVDDYMHPNEVWFYDGERWCFNGIDFPNGQQGDCKWDLRAKVLTQSEFKSEKKPKKTSYHKELCWKMWERCSNTDLEIRFAGGESLMVHREVLAATCDTWAVMLDGSMREKQEGLLKLTDVDVSIGTAFIKALYTLEVDDPKHLVGIARLADRYCARRLLSEILKRLNKAVRGGRFSKLYEVIGLVRTLTPSDATESLIQTIHECGINSSLAVFKSRFGIPAKRKREESHCSRNNKKQRQRSNSDILDRLYG